MIVAMVLNTLPAAAAIVLALEIAFRLFRGVNASTRFAARWLALAAIAALPLTELKVEQAPAAPDSQLRVEAPAPVQEEWQAEAPAPPSAYRVLPVKVPLPENVAGGIWAVIAAAGLLRLAASCMWLRRTKRHAKFLERRQGIAVLESAEIRGPMFAGLGRPAILLPAGFAARLSESELEHILLHEIAHARRRDDWTNLAAGMLRALLWFHPAVLWLLRRIAQDREMACDEWVVQATGESREYAASLARLSELRLRDRMSLAAPGTLGGGASLARRIESLLGRRGPVRARLSWSRVAITAAGVAALFIAAAAAPQFIAAAPYSTVCILDAGPQEPAQAARPAQAPQPAPAPQPAQAPKPAQAPEPAQAPQPSQPARRQGLLAGLAAAGYTDLDVDQIIALKNAGVTADYLVRMREAGFGRLTPEQLIQFRNHGVRPETVEGFARAGLANLTVKDVIELAVHGVKPATIAEIHTLGFGPYSTRNVIDFAVHGIRADLFRALKDYGITQVSAQDVIQAATYGLSARDLKEAREYGPSLGFQQILKLKKAGVI